MIKKRDTLEETIRFLITEDKRGQLQPNKKYVVASRVNSETGRFSVIECTTDSEGEVKYITKYEGKYRTDQHSVNSLDLRELIKAPL